MQAAFPAGLHCTPRATPAPWKQLGGGGGNHFVEFGEPALEAPALGLGLEAGVYLALLSHSGSRGTGEEVATRYSQIAMRLRPHLPPELKHLAGLDRRGAEGEEYWAAMQLMGRYAAANHELIHRHVLDHLGAEALTHVENHHNFAWEEEHDGQTVIVHRKRATPAGEGVLGVVPGSMGSAGLVVRGKGNAEALRSCSHGAGRRLSRSAAIKSLDRAVVRRYLEERGVHLISGVLDEAPMVYKDIHEVMAAQSDLVETLARFEPRLVKTAPDPPRAASWMVKKAVPLSGGQVPHSGHQTGEASIQSSHIPPRGGAVYKDNRNSEGVVYGYFAVTAEPAR